MNTAVKDLMIKRFPPGPRGRRHPEHFDAPGSIGNKSLKVAKLVFQFYCDIVFMAASIRACFFVSDSIEVSSLCRNVMSPCHQCENFFKLLSFQVLNI